MVRETLAYEVSPDIKSCKGFQRIKNRNFISCCIIAFVIFFHKLFEEFDSNPSSCTNNMLFSDVPFLSSLTDLI
jgi:hypothetical protein